MAILENLALRNGFGSFVVGAALFAACLSTAQAAEYYRYKNDQGVLVINNHIPPEFVSKGYSIVNESGMLVRKVAPAPTDADRAAWQLKHEAEQAKLAQRKQDEQLLSRYASVADIHASKKRVGAEIEARIAILRGSLRSQRNLLDAQLQKAANIEKSGHEVSDALRANLSALEREIDNTRVNIKKRKAELKVVDGQYEKEELRFRFLMERRYGRALD